MVCECGWDTWYIKMEDDWETIEGYLCANPECENFVEYPQIVFEVDLD
jgi:hypothetical protein